MKPTKIILFIAAFFAVALGFAEDDKFPLSIATENYPHVRPIIEGAVHIPECRISYSTVTVASLKVRYAQESLGDVVEVDLEAYLKRFVTEEKHDWVLIPVFLLRQFPDKPVDELKKEFSETRVFPIRTALAVRAELVEANPWLPEALFKAFCEAKQQVMEAGTMSLPLGAETVEVMGKNYWSYGVKDNPKSLAALTNTVKIDDLFAEETFLLLDTYGGNKE